MPEYTRCFKMLNYPYNTTGRGAAACKIQAKTRTTIESHAQQHVPNTSQKKNDVDGTAALVCSTFQLTSLPTQLNKNTNMLNL